MNHFTSELEKGFIDVDGKKKFTFVISTTNIDRVGDSIDVRGIDTSEYNRNPIVLRNHGGKTIGTSTLRLEGSKLLADVWFDEVSLESQEAKQQIELGSLRTASVGLEVLETSIRNMTDIEKNNIKRKWITQVRNIDKSILYEWSIVDMPANIEAELVRGISKGLEIDKLELIKAFNKDYEDTMLEKAGAKLSSKNKARLIEAVEKLNEILQELETETDTEKDYNLQIEEFRLELDELKNLVTLQDETIKNLKPIEVEKKKLTYDEYLKLSKD